ncbi:MAG: hypothetical protein OXF56_19725 [Rhodobacteraceae bacterium]|nr:hypothetical protein [Paracoccaceae bacterium]
MAIWRIWPGYCARVDGLVDDPRRAVAAADVGEADAAPVGLGTRAERGHDCLRAPAQGEEGKLHPPVRKAPAHFPAAPVTGPVVDIRRVILSAFLTSRTFTAVLSRIATFSLHRETRCVLLSSSSSALAID